MKIFNTGDAVLNNVVAHQASGFLGIDGNHTIIRVSVFLENGCDHLRSQEIGFYGFKIFQRGQIDHHA